MKVLRSLIALTGALALGHSADQYRKIPLDEAKRLVLAALPSKTKELPGLTLTEHDDPSFPRFYFVSALWIGEANGSVVIGHFAVDSRTGDVWSAIQCEEEKTGDLRRLQTRLRAEIGLTDAEYRKIKGKGPMCQ